MITWPGRWQVRSTEKKPCCARIRPLPPQVPQVCGCPPPAEPVPSRITTGNRHRDIALDAGSSGKYYVMTKIVTGAIRLAATGAAREFRKHLVKMSAKPPPPKPPPPVKPLAGSPSKAACPIRS